MRWAYFLMIAAVTLAVVLTTAQAEKRSDNTAVPNLESTNNPTMGQALGTSSEICVNDIVDVMTYQGIRQPLVKNEMSSFPAPSGEIIWYCGNNQKFTVCPEKTNYVVVEWASPYAFTFVCRKR